jgi:class 3 adenylate cyclase/tetratricopeptide (TPR) repeat protein
VLACRKCAAPGLPGARFCSACGAALAAAPEQGGARRGADIEPEPERRQLTVMFCDLVESTALSKRIDAEELRKLIIAYRDACGEAIERHGGEIARFMGDGLLVYFGYPKAHEDDPARAVRAGLAILAAMAELNLRLGKEGQPALHVRIGVHTGVVVAGDISTGRHRETMAVVGDTPAIAARVQQAAPIDCVVVTAATHAIVQGYFVCRALGKHVFKGIDEPVDIFAVHAETAARSRLEAARQMTPLAGRNEYLELLFDRWHNVREMQGHAVLLLGEAGIGKSRLVRELVKRAAEEPCSVLLGRCSPYHLDSPFFPVLEAAEAILDLVNVGSSERRQRVTAALAARGLSESAAMALEQLLSPEPNGAEDDGTAPTRSKRELHEALSALILSESEKKPVLLVFEDLHWADDSTLQFIDALLPQIAFCRMAIVGTAREIERWTPSPLLSTIRLDRLSLGESRQLIASVAGAASLPTPTVQRLIERGDGIPLYLEELTKSAVLDLADRSSGSGAGEALAGPEIPATLRDSLVARLDRLQRSKTLVQLCAAVGRSFSIDLIRAVAGIAHDELEAALGELVEARFLIRRHLPFRQTYTFQHALVQEAAYESALIETRRRYHVRIAEALTRVDDAGMATPELVARHWALGGRAEEAVRAWSTAARRASEQGANTEALQHIANAMGALRTLPRSVGRQREEFALEISYAAQTLSIKGNAAPEVERCYERALALADEVGDPQLRSRAMRGLQTFHMVRGRLAPADQISRQLLRDAIASKSPERLIQAHRPFGLCLLYQGKLDQARRHLQRTIELYDPQKHAPQRFEYGSDPLVLAQCHLGWVEWLAGHRALGGRLGDDAVSFARTLAHPHTLAFALSFRACLHQFRRDAASAFVAASELIELARAKDYAYWRAWGEIVAGWALAMEGADQRGIQLLREGLANYEATGADLMLPYGRTLLAEVLAVSDTRLALALVERALKDAGENRIGFYAAAMLRIRGDILALQNPAKASNSYRRAMSVARRQRAASLGLHAAVALYERNRDEDPRGTLTFMEEFEVDELAEFEILARRRADAVHGSADLRRSTGVV